MEWGLVVAGTVVRVAQNSAPSFQLGVVSLGNVAAKLCSYKTQPSEDAVCCFNAFVSLASLLVHVMELNVRL